MRLQIEEGRLPMTAAACAFYATLALFPGITMLIALYGLLFDPVTVVPQLNLLRDVLPPDVFVLIARQVHALVTQRPMDLQLSVGITALITLWSASISTKSMLTAIGHAHGRHKRNLWRFQVTGVAMTLCAAVAAVLTLAILVALPQALRLFAPSVMMRSAIHLVSYAVLIGFVAASISALYHFGSPPGSKAPVGPGALAATLMWLATTLLFSVYVSRVAPLHSTYGPIAAVAGVMIWFWMSTLIVLLGAELNAALGGRDEEIRR